LCDLQLPDKDMDGMDVLRHIKDTRPSSEVIVMTGYGSVERAVEATKAGAFWFLEKPFDFDVLMPLVERALERHELMTETESMRRQLSTRTEYFNIIGASRQMQQIYETIESVAKSDANVLIVGESGTGKELIANAIHYNSLRAKKPFIKVNCAALPKELIESELFGHTKGAFTGAHADKDGLIQHAEGGSLLLDEIAEMPVELQPKLLRVLQERSYRKLGSERTYPVDFRLISSTNRPPADAIRDGLLRDDLFYRISTITIHVPPLRERSEDIQLLAEHFLKMYARKYQRPITGISQAAYQRLFSHAWPGNVRELQNVMERAVLLAKGNKIEPVDLPFDNGSIPEKNAAGAGWDVPPNMTLEEIEKFVIERTLQRTGGNKQAAANLLGIYRPRLYSKIKKYKIDIPALITT
ncbi:MAG TPA: sigma-54 dependent transcriptional regulator, partial [Pyrinomonadaceae bacterium]|nr:sigma-54 dependent transcriptional regulator [Pyrinomonadaceae bacterium]